jgi:hypothetical protein
LTVTCAPEAKRFPLKNFMIFGNGITTVCYISSSPQLVKRTLQGNRYYLSPIKNKELKIIPTSLRFDFRRIRPHNETFFFLFVAVFQDSMLGIRYGRRPNFLRRLLEVLPYPRTGGHRRGLAVCSVCQKMATCNSFVFIIRYCCKDTSIILSVS